MITIYGPKTIFVDIDNTLALWNKEVFYPNEECILKIKQFHEREHVLVAWSAGGALWAKKVVERFGLQKYFALCISKPDWYMDDLKSDHFLPEINRIFFKNT